MANERRRQSPPEKIPEEQAGEPFAAHGQPVFEESATLREPADPRGPRSRISREAREATEELLHEIFEESPAGTSEPDLAPRPAPSPAEEDWPSELHPMHFRGA